MKVIDGLTEMGLHNWAAEARALEERAADAEAAEVKTAQAVQDQIDMRKRLNAAEAEVARLTKECNERSRSAEYHANLASTHMQQVLRLRDDVQYLEDGNTRFVAERDALRTDASRVVKERDMFAADCTVLRAKLEKVHGRLNGTVEPDGGLVSDILAILDGEGDDET